MHSYWVKKAKQGKIYKALSNKYVSPKGFTPWNDTAFLFSLAGDVEAVNFISKGENIKDVAAMIDCAHAANIAGAFDAPAVYVEPSLAEAVLYTDVNAMERPHTVLPVFFICLPCGFLYDEDGVEITSILVVENFTFLAASAALSNMPEDRKKKVFTAAKEAGQLRDLRIFTVNTGGAITTASTGWDEATVVDDAQLDTINYPVPGGNIKAFMSVLTKIRRVVKNVILIYNYQKDLVEEVVVSKGTGFGKHRSSKPRVSLPTTVLGRNFLTMRTRTSLATKKSEIRVRPHWRKGHWHTVLTGAGRKERRLRWFQPVYVNPTLDT